MYKIIKAGDTCMVVESTDDEEVIEHKIPITLIGDTEEDLICLVREIYHDTRLQHKYRKKQEMAKDYDTYLDSWEEDEEYIPDLTELFE